MPKFATNKTLHGLQNNLTIDRNTLKDGRSPNLLTPFFDDKATF